MADPEPIQVEQIESGTETSAGRGLGYDVALSPRDEREISRLFWLIEDTPDVGERVGAVSAEWLGRPYLDNPLDLRGTKESVRVNLRGFDCVTLIESAFAMALSEDVSTFIKALRLIRYHEGTVNWSSRNHYMTDWMTNNIALGIVRDLTTGQGSIEQIAVLNVVDGLPPKLTAFRYFPQENLPSLKRRMQTGDLVCFASTRPGLDVYHTGILIASDDGIVLRHASRSAGMVIDQDLDRFVAESSMLGVVLVRPTAPKRGRFAT